MTYDNWLNLTGIFAAGLIIIFFIVLIVVKHKKDEENLKDEENVKDEKIAQDAQQTPDEHSWLARLHKGLHATRANLTHGLNQFFLSNKDKITRDETLQTLFELLITCDVGVETSELLVARVKAKMMPGDIHDYKKFEALLKSEILNLLTSVPSSSGLERALMPQDENDKPHADSVKPYVIMLVGVNGVGKTTTTGKLAYKASQMQKKVIIGAADTFRAAAVEQLAIWADRSHATLIQLKNQADPASVAFESVKQAIQENFDVCLIDTAGRLQTRQDLMQELSKVGRVISKQLPNAPHEVLLVLDASMGQNAIEQAKLFQTAINVTGIVLTKLDGTAKGGVVLAIASKLRLPICYIGVGEAVEDLHPFHAQEYTDALFS